MEIQQVPNKNAAYLLALTMVVNSSFLAIVSSFVPGIWFATWFFIVASCTICYSLVVPRSPAFSPSMKKPSVAFVVGFLPFVIMLAFRLLFAKGDHSHFDDYVIIFLPIALLLGASGFFYYKSTSGNKFFNLGIGVLCTLIATVYFFFLFLW
jgi:hypothetical protein